MTLRTAPRGVVAVQPLEFAGEPSADKRNRLAEVLREAGQAAAILTLPDSLSWLLNIRGTDIARNPVVQCLGVLLPDGTLDLFIDPGACDPDSGIQEWPRAASG